MSANVFDKVKNICTHTPILGSIPILRLEVTLTVRVKQKERVHLFLISLPLTNNRMRSYERGIVSMVEQWSPKPEVKGSNPFSPDLLAFLLVF